MHEENESLKVNLTSKSLRKSILDQNAVTPIDRETNVVRALSQPFSSHDRDLSMCVQSASRGSKGPEVSR